MERDITKKLTAWKNARNRKPLLITGVRQCGKTYILKKFGEEQFADTAYFNFDGNRGLASVFEPDFDSRRIIRELGSIVRRKKIIPGETLIIFDEIQACPRAISALKYFFEEVPELHIVCAGSLLGVALKSESISFPVGKVNTMTMYPMSFKEFLQALDMGNIVEVLEERAGTELTEELSELYSEPLKRALKDYYVVGGMPEAVKTWTETQSLDEVDEVLEEILKNYAFDFGKHAPKNDFIKLEWIWDSVPVQLAKENNKFVFSHVKAGKRSADLEDALQWLINSGLVEPLYLVQNPELPLSFASDRTYFKIYMSDVGLLRKKSGLAPETIFSEDALYSKFKGALTENSVMTELVKAGYSPYFWRSGNTAELDFLIEDKGRIIPIEAKAEYRTRAKSYLQFCKKYRTQCGFRLSMKNVGVNYAEDTLTYSLPLYLLWDLKAYLNIDET